MRKLTILMIGWEYPPFNSGGLGVACQGIAEALTRAGHQVVFILPESQAINQTTFPIYFAEKNSSNNQAKTNLWYGGYGDLYKSQTRIIGNNKIKLENNISIVKQALKYGQKIKDLIIELNNKYQFDLIHGHDWLTVPACLEAKEILKIPLFIHIHATEFDRTGGSYGNEDIRKIEKLGLDLADKVIAVSNYTKKIIIQEYKINPDKISFVHNGSESIIVQKKSGLFPWLENKKNNNQKIILFLGRLTIQKGVDYFLESLPLVFNHYENAIAVISGSGDSEFYLIDKTFELGIQDRVIFTGFVRNQEREAILSLADIFVVPSISEPFGLTPLEAAHFEIPVVLSKQSGASEVLKNSFLVDFWDKEKMAEQIIHLLTYEKLALVMKKNALINARHNTWDKSAEGYYNVYTELL